MSKRSYRGVEQQLDTLETYIDKETMSKIAKRFLTFQNQQAYEVQYDTRAYIDSLPRIRIPKTKRSLSRWRTLFRKEHPVMGDLSTHNEETRRLASKFVLNYLDWDSEGAHLDWGSEGCPLLISHLDRYPYKGRLDLG